MTATQSKCRYRTYAHPIRLPCCNFPRSLPRRELRTTWPRQRHNAPLSRFADPGHAHRAAYVGVKNRALKSLFLLPDDGP